MVALDRRSLPALVVTVVLAAACSPAADDGPESSPSTWGALRSDVAEYVEGRPGLGDDVRAVVVTVSGRTVLEQYQGSGEDEYHNVASVTKCVLSTLVGIAVDEGLLHLDASLAELLPQHAPSMTPDVAATTVSDLLTMTGPFPDTWVGGGIDPERPNWVVANLETAHRRPGTFAYSDPGVDVLAAALAEATGVTLLQYGREKLFGPLGIDTVPAVEELAVAENIRAFEEAGFAWMVDPQGLHIGGGALKLRARDLVRLGQLYLDEGEWDGRRVVSADWVRSATTAHVPTGHGAGDHYGYLWWVHETGDGHEAFLGWGFGGQLLEVVPALELVVVVQTEFRMFDTPPMKPQELTTLVDEVVVPAVEAVRTADR